MSLIFLCPSDGGGLTVVVSLSGVDGVVGVTRVLEFHEGERRPALILQIDEGDFAIFVEEIFDVLGPNVGRQVAHVDAAVAASARHDMGERPERPERVIWGGREDGDQTHTRAARESPIQHAILDSSSSSS